MQKGRYAHISTQCGPASGADLFYDKESIAKLMKSPHRTILMKNRILETTKYTKIVTISILLEFNCVTQLDTRCTD